MSRKPLKIETRKTKFSITINPLLFNKIDELKSNKSKYIERLIYEDLINKSLIVKNFEL